MKKLKEIRLIRNIRTIISIFIIALFSLHSLDHIDIPTLNRINGVFYDLRLEALMPEQVDPRIVILDIDEKSLANEGRWPWHRDKLAYLTDLLFDYYQIKTLAFDIVFSEPDIDPGLKMFTQLSEDELASNKEFQTVYEDINSRYAYDDIFATSLLNRSINLAFFTHNNLKDKNIGVLPSKINIPKPLAANTLSYLHKAPTYVSNIEKITNSASHGGFFNNPMVDEDGVYRGTPLLLTHEGAVYPSLALAVVQSIHEMAPIQFETTSNTNKSDNLGILNAITIAGIRIPVSPSSRILIPYLGKQGSFNYLSATDVLSGSVNPEELQDKIVLLGTTAAGLYDQRTTPVQAIFPGVEIQANIIRGIIDSDTKYRPQIVPVIEFLFVCILGLFTIMLFPRLVATEMLLCIIAMLVCALSFNFVLWFYFKMDSALATPILLILMLFINQILFGYFFESRRKKQLGNIFGQYIPKEIVKDMSLEPESYSLKGERKEMTVLFSDVRNFTTISEGMESEELVHLINEILTPVTSVIHRNKGTIDKYIGDAVMAFWGAPIFYEQHSELAVKSALEMITTVNELRDSFKHKQWPEIKVGIGINTGPMTVGNMGSEFRLAYTVMGDAVNLGSRLEGLTKQYGVDIIVSQFTKEAAPDYLYRELDLVRVKGKQEPIAIFEPVCLAKDADNNIHIELNLLNKALTSYRTQAWELAKGLFNQLADTYPNTILYSIYLTRIEEFKNNKPDPNWDGVYTFTNK